MDTYSLKELCRESGGKNVICQFLSPSITISLAEVEEKRGYMVIEDKGVRRERERGTGACPSIHFQQVA